MMSHFLCRLSIVFTSVRPNQERPPFGVRNTTTLAASAAIRNCSISLRDSCLTFGISRTAFAMARGGDAPRWLGAVHPRFQVPHHAELAVGAVVAVAVVLVDLRSAIGFSSVAVLLYYAITNAAALRLGRDERRWPRALAGLGLAGCLTLALTLPIESVAAGAAVVAGGALLYRLSR